MPAFTYFSDELLQPISSERPCGVDLRYTPLFTEIAEARRYDDDLSAGVWETEGGKKSAAWDRVAELCLAALREHSKDLRILVYLTEAGLRLDGFGGLRDCLRLTTELVRRYGDEGLFPLAEDGDQEYRASALAWLNERMPVILGSVPITARTGAENYGFTRYKQGLEVGPEAAIATASADTRERKLGLIRQGWITMDQFDAALKATKRKDLEIIYQPFDEAYQELVGLEKVADERFGPSPPSFSDIKETFSEIRKILAGALKKRQQEEPDQAGKAELPGNQPGATASMRPNITGPNPSTYADDGKAWEEAASLVSAGNLDRGLAQMAALAAQETTGRGRFLRKLMLSEVCLSNGRDRMARTILEELNSQINEYKLDRWESSALIGPVWSLLYKLYRKSENSSEKDRSLELYNRLCSLDPWQAYLTCED